LTCIGLKQYSFSSEDQQEQADDGKFIIEQYKSEVLIKYGPATTGRGKDGESYKSGEYEK
jgi:hypothetical protein